MALAKSTIILSMIPVSAKSFSMYGSSAQMTRMASPGPGKQKHSTAIQNTYTDHGNIKLQLSKRNSHMQSFSEDIRIP